MIPISLVFCVRWVPGIEIAHFFVAAIVAVFFELAIVLSTHFLKPSIEVAIERSKSISGGLYAMVMIAILPLIFGYWFFWLQFTDRWVEGFSLQGIWAYIAGMLALSIGKYSFKSFYDRLLLRVGVPAFLLDLDDNTEE